MDEENDDFDSLFFAKYKKLNSNNSNSLSSSSSTQSQQQQQRFSRFSNCNEGLSMIPELATDLVTSTEFG